MRKVAIVLGLLVMTMGCAKLTHVRVASHGEPSGFPYYQGCWYLLVHTDGKGALTTRLLFLPDRTRPMEARPFNLLARLESSLTFSNGVLGSSKTSSDSTAVPRALIQAAEKIASAMMVANANAEPDRAVLPGPRIFRLEIAGMDTEGPTAIRVIGGESSKPNIVYVSK